MTIKRFEAQTKDTRVYPFICPNALLEKADVIAALNHQSLASFVRQSVAAAVNNYRATSAS